MSSLPRSRKLTATVADRVRDELLEQILAGSLSAGDRLYQDELARDLGVSRVPLREGLARLEAEGFVVTEPHQGAMVAPLSLEDGRELFQLRALLETRLLRLAINNADPADLKEAYVLLERLHGAERNLERRARRNDWTDLNWLFHERLYRAAGQPRTLAVVRTLHLHAQRYVAMQNEMSGREERSRDEHYTLLRLCEAKEVDLAVTMLEEHVLNILPDLEHLGLPHGESGAAPPRVDRMRRTARRVASAPSSKDET